MAEKFSKQEEQRIGYIDALKGFGILCVVLGHVAGGYLTLGVYPEVYGLLEGIYNFVYAFHMPLFMMLSGYLYNTAYFDGGGRPDNARVRRHLCDLIGVYFIYSLLWGFLKFFSATLAGVAMQQEITLSDIMLVWINPLDIYWYLYVLIFFYLLFSVRQVAGADKWLLLVILTAVTVVGEKMDYIPWFEITRMIYYALFFFIGIAGSKYKDWIIGNRYLTLVFLAAALGRDALQEKIPAISSGIIVALGISLTLWYVFEHIRFIGSIRILRFCGRYSLEIYVLHNIIVSALKRAIPKAGIHDPYINIALNLLISTAVPIVFAVLCKKLGLHEWFFKPVTQLTKKCLHSRT